MYLGRMCELAEVGELYANPRHPYSVALLSAVPDPDPRIRRRHIVLKGDVPSPANPPSGCRFHTRCWLREQLGNPEICSRDDPQMREIAPGHMVSCHFAESISESTVKNASSGEGVIVADTAEPADTADAAA
jgi:oligopeptide/dipeptide ABC transporter ATP-binding protein